MQTKTCSLLLATCNSFFIRFQQAPKRQRCQGHRGDGSERETESRADAREQAQTIVAIDDNAAHGAEQKARRCLTETENTQCPNRPGDLIGKPIERDLTDKLTDRRDQIARPKKRVVLVQQRSKDGNRNAPVESTL